MSLNKFSGTLSGRFLRGLALSRDRHAIRAQDRSLTYEQAHEMALAWAGSLLHACDEPPGAIGVLAGKGVASYVGILAALYCGVPAVPFQPDFPADRTRHMLRAAGVSALIADEKGFQLLPELLEAPGIPVLRPGVAAGGSPSLGFAPRQRLSLAEPRPARPSDAAYILFTSGSTGRPKGMRITHANLDCYFRAIEARYSFGPGDVFSQVFDPAFDCGISDLFGAWGAGATLVSVPGHAYRALAEFVTAAGLTIWYSTPAAIAVAARRGGLAAGSLPTLRLSTFAGDALKAEDAAMWQRAASASVLDNLYGPAETTITCTVYRWSQESSPGECLNGIVPIGRLHDGHDYLLLDPDGEQSADEGELCVSGPQVTPGYLDPADEQARFFGRGSRRWYRTGDRMRRAANGDLLFLGRTDNQVQIQGWRTELTEVDHHLRRCAGVEDAVTVPASVGGQLQLVAFYTGQPAAAADLARQLLHVLPQQMLPRHYQHVAELPLSVNAKIDRKALRQRAVELFGGAVRPGVGASEGTSDGSAPVSAPHLHGLLDAAAAAAPTAPAIRDADDQWSYSRLARLSHAAAGWLAGRGVSAGDRVLVQVPNGRELAALLFGCSRLGAIFVPVNPGTKPFHLRSVLANCEPRVVLAADGTAGAIREFSGAEVYELRGMWPDIESGGCAPPACVTGHDVAVLLYTSGSTGAPKAITCPQAQMVFAATAIGSVLGYRPDDVIFCRLPLSFDYGLYQILLACLARAEVVVSGTGPDVTLLRQLRQSGATVVPVVPSLASMLITLAGRDRGQNVPDRVRLFTNTGAALPQVTIDGLRRRFPGARVARMFGTTECKRITIMPPHAELERPGSVGPPLPGTEVVILDQAGLPVPAGQTGEIVVSGPHVMAGYWRAPEITARTFRPDGPDGRVRLYTGDYGHLDQDGYLYFEGRRDDMFKHKGTRVSTLEIEAAAMDIPGVRGAVVLPPADGEELEICVATEVAAHVVLRELAYRLEAAKVPTACHVVADIPLTLNGKSERGTVGRLIQDQRNSRPSNRPDARQSLM
jgi:amino acid adenylation domain-containing protein